jgi:hypothetical protein
LSHTLFPLNGTFSVKTDGRAILVVHANTDVQQQPGLAVERSNLTGTLLL